MILSALLCVPLVQDSAHLTVLARDLEHRIGVQRDDEERAWINAQLLPQLTGFELRPEGLCSGDLCIPWSDPTGKRQAAEEAQVDLAAVLKQLHIARATSQAGDVWSLAPAPARRKLGLESGLAPELELMDREGKPWRLSDLRGHKVVLLTWASW